MHGSNHAVNRHNGLPSSGLLFVRGGGQHYAWAAIYVPRVCCSGEQSVHLYRMQPVLRMQVTAYQEALCMGCCRDDLVSYGAQYRCSTVCCVLRCGASLI